MLAEYYRCDMLNDEPVREARLEHSTVETSWLLSHLKRDKPGYREIMSVKDWPQRPERERHFREYRAELKIDKLGF